jgi:hypothetical protein
LISSNEFLIKEKVIEIKEIDMRMIIKKFEIKKVKSVNHVRKYRFK